MQLRFIAARGASFFADQLRLSVSRLRDGVRSSHCRHWGAVLSLVLGSCSVAIVSGCGFSVDKVTAAATAATGGTLVFSTSAISFGSVMVGQTASASVSMSNGTTNSVQISGVQVTGQFFSVVGQDNLPVTLAGGSTYNVKVQFDPGAAGTATGVLTVLSNAAGGGAATIALSGTGESSPSPEPAPEPALTLQSTSVSFGDVTLNTPSTQTVTLSSSGTAPLAISAGTVTGTGFSLSGLSFPATLNPGQTATLSIEFDPAAAGAATGTVTLTDNASPGTATIALSGTGESSPSPEPALTLQSTSVSFGDVTLNTPSTQTVTLSSSGTAPLTISAGTVTGTGFSLSGVSFPVTLNPGQAATLSIEFDPAAAGAATGTVTLIDNASPGTATIALSGTGQAVSYEVDLTWDAPGGSVPVTGYDIYRAVSGSSSYQLLNSTIDASTTYTDTTVVDGKAYQYYVTSVDASGNQSPPSDVFSVTIP